MKDQHQLKSDIIRKEFVKTHEYIRSLEGEVEFLKHVLKAVILSHGYDKSYFPYRGVLTTKHDLEFTWDYVKVVPVEND